MTGERRSRVAAGARRGAWLAFCALVVLSPLRARLTLEPRLTVPVYGDYTDFLLSWSEIAAIAVLVLWGLSLALRPRRVDLGPRLLAWPVAALIAVAWATVPFSVDPALGAYTAIHLCGYAALSLYAVNEVRRLDRVVVPLVLAVAAEALVGIVQVSLQRSVGLEALGEHLLSPILGVSVVTAGDGTRLLRAYGLTDHPNILGGLLAMALVVLGGSAAAGRGRRRWACAVTVALGGAALLLTFSRGAWVGLAAGLAVLCVMLAVEGDRVALRRVTGVCAAGVLVAMPVAVSHQTALAARADQTAANATERRSVDERVALSQATVRIAAAHPLTGTGAGTLPVAMRAADPSFPYSYQPASIAALDVGAETGIAGAGAYLVILAAPWLLLWRSRGRWTRELSVVSAAVATASVLGLFDYYTWTYTAGRIWWWLLLGLWAAAHRTAVTGTR